MAILKWKWPRHPLLFWGCKRLRQLLEVHKPKSLVWLSGNWEGREQLCPWRKHRSSLLNFYYKPKHSVRCGITNKMHLAMTAFSGGGAIEGCLVPVPHSTNWHCSVTPLRKQRELPRRSTVAYPVTLWLISPQGVSNDLGPERKANGLMQSWRDRRTEVLVLALGVGIWLEEGR